MEGFHSLEEAVQEYIGLFAVWQRADGERADGALLEKVFWEREKLLTQRERLSDIFLPWRYLEERCALTEGEYWLVMLAFCCEVEEGLCMDFRGGSHGKWPTLQQALHLLSSALPVGFDLIAGLCGERGRLACILRHYSKGGDEEEERGLLSGPLLLNRTAFYFLLTGELPGEDWYEPFLVGDREETFCGGGLLPLHMGEYDRLRRCLNEAGRVRILLHGDRGSGRRTLLRRVCRDGQLNAVFVKMSRLWKENQQCRSRRRQELLLICRLAEPVIIADLTGAIFDEAFTPEKANALLGAFVSGELEACRMIFLAESTREDELAGELAEIRMDLRDSLSAEELRLALDAWLAPEERRVWQEQLLAGYRLSIGEFRRKQRAVCLQARAEHISPAERRAWVKGLAEQGGYFGLGRVIKADCCLEDLVLSGECRAQLETVIRLAEGWSGGGGFCLLFHGSSGTGKTMAASVLAGRLQRPLFKVDISRIYDKYIGETEKHLDEIFRTARRNRCLLFFDEADALFSRRTSIRDSHDKYANISTAYLLQRMEEYDGIVILATNLMDHFDDAFVRRIRFVVKFHDLDTEGRRRLWEKVLEGSPGVSGDVAFESLAQAASLSPARIKAAAQAARLLAVCEGSGNVTREHLKKALELEAGKDETAIRLFN